MRPIDLGWSKRARAPCTPDDGVSRGARKCIRVTDPSKAIAADLDHRATQVGQQLVFTDGVNQGAIAGAQHPKAALQLCQSRLRRGLDHSAAGVGPHRAMRRFGILDHC